VSVSASWPAWWETQCPTQSAFPTRAARHVFTPIGAFLRDDSGLSESPSDADVITLVNRGIGNGKVAYDGATVCAIFSGNGVATRLVRPAGPGRRPGRRPGHLADTR